MGPTLTIKGPLTTKSHILMSDRTKIVLTAYDSNRDYEFKIENGIQEERK